MFTLAFATNLSFVHACTSGLKSKANLFDGITFPCTLFVAYSCTSPSGPTSVTSIVIPSVEDVSSSVIGGLCAAFFFVCIFATIGVPGFTFLASGVFTVYGCSENWTEPSPSFSARLVVAAPVNLELHELPMTLYTYACDAVAHISVIRSINSIFFIFYHLFALVLCCCLKNLSLYCLSCCCVYYCAWFSFFFSFVYYEVYVEFLEFF